MDSRDLIIIAVLGIGGWLWWKGRQATAGASSSTSVPGAVANPAGAASMVAGAAAQVRAGLGTAQGVFWGGAPPEDAVTGSVATIRAAAARNAVAKLQVAQTAPQPVALTPRVTASPAGIRPIQPVRPPAQQLTTALTILGLRGVN